LSGERAAPFAPAARAVGLVFFVNGFLFGCWAARIPAVTDDLGMSEGRLGIALGGIAAGALVSMPLSGAWCAHAGSRRPTRTLLASMCVVPVLLTAAPSFGLLVAAAVLMGLSNGGLDVAMNTQGSTVERRSGRLLLGRLHAAWSGGGLAGAGLGALAAAVGLHQTLHLAIAGLACGAVAIPVTRALLHGDATRDHAPTFARPSRPLLGLGLLAFCCLLAEGAAADWSAVYLDDTLGADKAFAALAYAAFSAAMLLGRLVSDRLSTAFGPTLLLRGGGTLAGGGLALAIAVATPTAALAGFAALGAGLSVVIPLTFRAAAGAGGAPSLAAVSTTGYLGFLTGPPIIGAIAEATSLDAGLLVVAVLAASAAVLGGAVRRVPATAPAPA
jgi:predicted MFS family arabinose efflux permease